MKARNFIHSKIEENIKKKLQESQREPKHRDALQQLIDSSSRNGEQLSMQVLEGISSSSCKNRVPVSWESPEVTEVSLPSSSGHQGVGYRAVVWRP